MRNCGRRCITTGKAINELTVNELTSAKFYELLSESKEYQNAMTRGELEFKILEQAKALGVRQHVFDQLKVLKRAMAEKQKKKQSVEGVTDFGPDITGKEYTNMYCGSWIATDDGIYSMESSKANQIACYHPILPIRRMRNVETGEEQITLAYKRGENGLWQEITVPKEVVANSRQITVLAKYGLGITSETARLLVRYIATVESRNEDFITLVKSSSKLGWHEKKFLPYDDGIVFDAELRFPQIFNSINEHGSYDTWLNHVRGIRANNYIEPRIALAASFASVIIKFLNIASVIVDFNGATEAGKTVMLMLATSVWACPDEGQYMGDFLTTDAELEVRCDMLNNLPLVLDDTSKMKKNIKDNIEQVIYNLSSGSGKKRSNKELGSERVRTWKNAVIINGERPLNSFVEQGGAINRIIEVDVTGIRLFENPSETADLIRDNYGFAGRIFVEAVKEMTVSEIRSMHEKYVSELKTEDTMQKQVLSMAAILVADEIAERAVFGDGRNLSAKDVSKYLTKRSQVEEGARCYEYLLSILEEKGQHFDLQFGNIDQWGTITYEDGIEWVNFYVNAFNDRVNEAGFSRKAFTSWAMRNGILRANNKDAYQIHRRRGGEDKNIKFISFRSVDLDEYLAEQKMFG